MNRSEKEKMVESIREDFTNSDFICLTDFKGLNVPEISALRHELRSSGAEYHVVKNTMAIRAIAGTGLEELGKHFAGPTAAAVTNTDPAAPAKILVRFAKENPKLEFKSGLLQGKELTREDIEALAKLPGREVLLSSLLGTLKAPSGGFVNVMAAIIRKFVGTLQAIEQEKAKTADS